MDYDISSPEQVEQEAAKHEKEEIQAREDLKEIMALPAGQRFFRRFFEKTYLFKNPMAKGPWIYFNCGIQNIAQMISSDLLQADRNLAIKILFPEE